MLTVLGEIYMGAVVEDGIRVAEELGLQLFIRDNG